MHVAAVVTFCLVPLTWTSAAIGLTLYLVRMFGITGGYHRYFSHRAYKTSRAFQFLLGFIGCAAMQKGPLWWASHHRIHHKYSDEEEDPHSPIVNTIWWSHVGWVISGRFQKIHWDQVRDFRKFPELRMLDLLHWLPGFALAGACAAIDGWSGIMWGFIVSTVALYHTTFMVNSLCHLFGTRRFVTTDASRNNWLVALLTLGEGWHNNHHHYQSCARQGFKWWEVDVSYYILRTLKVLGVVWDVREPTEKAKGMKRVADAVAPQPAPTAAG